MLSGKAYDDYTDDTYLFSYINLRIKEIYNNN